MNKPERLSMVPGGTLEESVIDESQWGAIRALRQQGTSKKAIARQLDLDIKTVRKWLGQRWEPQRRRRRKRKLERYAEFLRGRSPEVGFNAEVLFRELRKMGFEGSYPTVVRYIRPWRQAWREASSATVRFETDPGEQSQVDWGSTRVWLGDEAVRIHLFAMVLGYSRRLFAKAYGNERLDALLNGHESAFAHFGGATRTILYDNPRTIVKDKDEASGHVVWNPAFKDRLDFYGIEPRLCRYYRAQTKGKIESGIKYVKRNALAGRRFGDLEELNAWLVQWCVSVADQRVHGTTGERPAQRFARGELELLRPVHLKAPPPRERVESRLVPRDGYVAVDTNRYPVPLSWVARQVEVLILTEEVVFRRAGEEPIRHPRLEGRHQVARWQGSSRKLPPSPAALEGPPYEAFFGGADKFEGDYKRFDKVTAADLKRVANRYLTKERSVTFDIMPGSRGGFGGIGSIGGGN